MRAPRLLLPLLVILALAAGQAIAQSQPDQGGGLDDPAGDPALAPLLQPSVLDFAPPAGFDPAPGFGATAGFEVVSGQSAGVLTPSYRFTPALSVKARVPLIFSRTYTYWNTEAKAGGLGDIGLEGEYRRAWPSGLDLRVQASVKLPTGDDGKTDTVDGADYATPLGTGSTDWFGRVQLAGGGAKLQWLGSLLYRTNGEQETITDFGGGSTMTTTTTRGDQFAGAAFARLNVHGRWWLHAGVTVLQVQDDEVDQSYSDGSPGSSWGVDASGTLVDVLPGVSYAVGRWCPFVGVRIPAATSWDSPLRAESRDTAFVAQVSWTPALLAH